MTAAKGAVRSGRGTAKPQPSAAVAPAPEPASPVKIALIDWLLAHGTTSANYRGRVSTLKDALADLAARGVDYDASETPEVTDVLDTPGDTFTDATYVTAFTARIVPLPAESQGPASVYGPDAYAFRIDHDALLTTVITQIALSMTSAAEPAWKQRSAALDEQERMALRVARARRRASA